MRLMRAPAAAPPRPPPRSRRPPHRRRSKAAQARAVAPCAPAAPARPAPPPCCRPPPPRAWCCWRSRAAATATWSQWITVARRRAPKGQYLALMSDVEGKVPTRPRWPACPTAWLLLAAVPPNRLAQPFETLFAQAMWLKTWFGPTAARSRCRCCTARTTRCWSTWCSAWPRSPACRIVATGDVLMHARSRKPLQDVLTATRLRCPVAACGFALEPNAEAHLRSRARLARCTARMAGRHAGRWPGAAPSRSTSCATSTRARSCPPATRPPAGCASSRKRGACGASRPAATRRARHRSSTSWRSSPSCSYEPYFLTVADIVQWARSQGILCQGRGSAANSAVCYCLGVTEVDPARASAAVRALHQRRAQRAARHRHRLRAPAPRRGHPVHLPQVRPPPRRAHRRGHQLPAALGAARRGPRAGHRPRAHRRRGQEPALVRRPPHRPERLRENGFDPDAPLCRLWIELTQQLIGFPRHLSQHPGGFVIARDDLARLVPVENAAMEGRSVIQWDKDDLDALGLLKVDMLALGMLSAIRRALEMVGGQAGRAPIEFRMQEVPAEDPPPTPCCAAATASAPSRSKAARR
jgi:error-prone DNA polymerase